MEEKALGSEEKSKTDYPLTLSGDKLTAVSIALVEDGGSAWSAEPEFQRRFRFTVPGSAQQKSL